MRKFKLGGSRRELWTDLDHIEFDILHEDFENTEAAFELKTGGPLQGIILFAPVDNWEIAEFEIYGGGFVPRAEYISDIIDLGRPSSVDAVSWGGEVAPGARVEVSARSGADEDPNHYWRNTFLGDRRSRFDADGEELTFNTYRRLEGGEAAGISPDSENWEFWTAPADFSVEGLALTATSPHEYAQFSIDFESSNDAGQPPRLHPVRGHPAADRIARRRRDCPAGGAPRRGHGVHLQTAAGRSPGKLGVRQHPDPHSHCSCRHRCRAHRLTNAG